MKTYIKKKVQGEKTFADTYYDDVDFENGIMPLLKVLQYLNQLPVGDLSEEERLVLIIIRLPGESPLTKAPEVRKEKETILRLIMQKKSVKY